MSVQSDSIRVRGFLQEKPIDRARRKVFAGDSGPHVDLIPEDIGFGPYDTAFKAYQRRKKNP